MDSAQRRTLPLFEGEPGPPEPKPRKPSVRTLRTRLWKAALAWYCNPEAETYLHFNITAEALRQRMKEEA